jgi:hypothetical protein
MCHLYKCAHFTYTAKSWHIVSNVIKIQNIQDGDVAQEVELLPSKREVPSSNPSTVKKKQLKIEHFIIRRFNHSWKSLPVSCHQSQLPMPNFRVTQPWSDFCYYRLDLGLLDSSVVRITHNILFFFSVCLLSWGFWEHPCCLHWQFHSHCGRALWPVDDHTLPTHIPVGHLGS